MPKFNFEGFEPQATTKTLAKELLWQVESKAPSRSASIAGMRKTADGYQSYVRFTTTVGCIEAESSAELPDDSLRQTFTEITHRLEEWQKSRKRFT